MGTCRPGPASPSRTTGPRAVPAGSSCPPAVRDAVVALLGAPVTGVDVAGGGFTGGFAATVRTADGAAVFVKAASLTHRPGNRPDYANEAGDPGPAAGRAARPPAALGGDRRRPRDPGAGPPSTGRMPALPWDPADLSATLDAYAEVAAALRRTPGRAGRARPAPAGPRRLPRLAGVRLGGGAPAAGVAAGRRRAAAGPGRVRVEAARLRGGDGLAHCDLRVDNVLIDAGRPGVSSATGTGSAHGPAWFDLVGLLITAYAGGLRRRRPLRRSSGGGGGARATPWTWRSPRCSGLWLLRSADPPVAASPHLRGHQRWRRGDGARLVLRAPGPAARTPPFWLVPR